MDLSRLAEKQKRLKSWRDLVQGSTLPGDLIHDLNRSLGEYSGILVECWDRGLVSIDSEKKLADIENKLSQLDEESRLLAR